MSNKKYLATVARDNYGACLKAARCALHQSKFDRAAGDHEASIWWQISASENRKKAAEWKQRLDRVLSR